LPSTTRSTAPSPCSIFAEPVSISNVASWPTTTRLVPARGAVRTSARNGSGSDLRAAHRRIEAEHRVFAVRAARDEARGFPSRGRAGSRSPRRSARAAPRGLSPIRRACARPPSVRLRWLAQSADCSGSGVALRGIGGAMAKNQGEAAARSAFASPSRASA
jgi:hypothetical protein